MEVTGIIKAIEQTQEIGSKGFKKRDVVVTTDEQHPQVLSIQFVQDKCTILDNYQVGQNVKISVNLRGREWINPQGETKYFNTIQGWKIESIKNQTQPQTQENNDDLPF